MLWLALLRALPFLRHRWPVDGHSRNGVVGEQQQQQKLVVESVVAGMGRDDDCCLERVVAAELLVRLPSLDG